MSSTLILQIPEPCNEGWSNMTPTESGRHCQSCNRELIDFTQWSDSKLIDYLENNNGKLCGHFSPRQLNRNLLPTMQTVPSYSGLSLQALVLLAVTLTSVGALAVEHVDPVSPFSLVDFAGNVPKDTIRPTYAFSGIVFEQDTHIPIAEVHIVVSTDAGRIAQTLTDTNGVFVLEIPLEITDFQVAIFHASYEGVTLTEHAANASNRRLYQLSEIDISTIDGMMVISREDVKPSRRAARKAERANSRGVTKTE